MFQSVLRSEPELPGALPTELKLLIRRCMGRVPSTRFATALEVRGAIEAFLEHQGSRELEQQAESRASELLTLLQGTADLLRVSRLFSECRFGFQQALRVWPENAHAKAALARITAEMVRFELKQGSVRSAQALLSELMDPPADVVAALAQAEAAEAEKARELERLHQVALSVDPLTGSRVRTLLATALGSLWAISPLLMGRYHAAFPSQDETLLSLPVSLASLILMIVVARRTPPERRTQLNVQIANVIRFGMGVQLSALLVFSVFLGGAGRADDAHPPLLLVPPVGRPCLGAGSRHLAGASVLPADVVPRAPLARLALRVCRVGVRRVARHHARRVPPPDEGAGRT
jgi:serine/threonine-protein kinase